MKEISENVDKIDGERTTSKPLESTKQGVIFNDPVKMNRIQASAHATSLDYLDADIQKQVVERPEVKEAINRLSQPIESQDVNKMRQRLDVFANIFRS